MWQHTEGMVGFVENLLGFPAVKVFFCNFCRPLCTYLCWSLHQSSEKQVNVNLLKCL